MKTKKRSKRLPKFPKFTSDEKVLEYLNSDKFTKEVDKYLYIPMFKVLDTNRISIYHDVLAIKALIHCVVERIGMDHFRILWDMFHFDENNSKSFNMKILTSDDMNYIR